MDFQEPRGSAPAGLRHLPDAGDDVPLEGDLSVWRKPVLGFICPQKTPCPPPQGYWVVSVQLPAQGPRQLPAGSKWVQSVCLLGVGAPLG